MHNSFLYAPRGEMPPPGASRDYVTMVRAFAKREKRLPPEVLDAHKKFYDNMAKRSKQ
jgi:hypothetical protein